MACNSIQSSSSLCTRNFDVFLSFRGTDTHNGFIDHLFASLPRKGVAAFRDDQTIKKGNSWSLGILQAIEGLRVYIVVFSKDYALSTWCMKELAKIVDWVEETGRSVLPIFYDVTSFWGLKTEWRVQKSFWREALKAITNSCGWDVLNKYLIIFFYIIYMNLFFKVSCLSGDFGSLLYFGVSGHNMKKLKKLLKR